MAARDHLKVVLRTIVGPFLREQGFKGSGTSWLLRSASSDVAVVNVQSSKFSNADRLDCLINLAVVPAPWWEWEHKDLSAAPTSTPKEYDGLWRDRLSPTGAEPGYEAWWTITDEQSSAVVAVDMVDRLQSRGVPTLRRLLDRSEFIASVRRADLGPLTGLVHRRFLDRALAILLADDGPSTELDEVLTRLALDPGEVGGIAAPDLIAWAKARASGRAKDGTTGG
ncbi:DUF4304 domain-containing protein [Frankia sp. AgB1.9]|uniref:DUF4304 domain-containing protein n=1 Tax=unclassified Frankia TaxID=2632575 RepID=UPI001933A410|nr:MULTISPECIES: DUF4304 domain-containing protein [unclassified Frankia]MBL7493456.1 DUF4304 domain-containing protein [Frankia sp. AgW1.1]MBL7548592.1 DUF4304 domain-containing protein [Frankia sp. AgB1.9]MBL7623384.1 DUF4304 domain-containing protein [Frankia sp. AgB1.8]